MKHHRLEDMVKGWFVGDLVAFRSAETEVGVKTYSAGNREAKHHHKVATELTLIISGKVRMLDRRSPTRLSPRWRDAPAGVKTAPRPSRGSAIGNAL